MRQPRVKKHRRARFSVGAAAGAFQRHREVQALKQWPGRFTKTFKQFHMPYRMFVLLAPVVVSLLDWSMWRTLLPVASIMCIKTSQAVQWLKQWPCRLATALGQPYVQYRLMLLLAVLLAGLIGWSMAFSAVLHLPLALCTGCVSAKG